MSADHVVIDQVRCCFRCANCGAEQPIILPMEIGALAALSKPFLAAHQGCK